MNTQSGIRSLRIIADTMKCLSRVPWLVSAALLGFVSTSVWSDDREVPPKPEVHETDIQRGMTAAEVLKRLGPPKRTARQILYRRFLEQWTYDLPTPVLIELECVKGQSPHVLRTHKLPEAKP